MTAVNFSAPDVSVPTSAITTLSRCNIRPAELASLHFQRHPTPLTLDGVLPSHRHLFTFLDQCENAADRARLFERYMNAHFLLDRPEDNGWHEGQSCDRRRADYRALIRGWHMDTASREAAVLKAWVTSRFGLVTRFHGGPVADEDGEGLARYMASCARGSYNTNALSMQLDLLFSYAQYVLQNTPRYSKGITLYRGIGDRREVRPLYRRGKRAVLLLNNLSSFAVDQERADEFGDTIFRVHIPREKILCFDGLLPGVLKSEAECLVIGGLVEGMFVS
jgi:NAD+--dinitrogen-reductase ADP-D-ribosyltransferase